jgi:hypothetical protein
MKARALLVVVLLLALSSLGKAQSKHIHEQVDPYTGLRKLFLGDIQTRGCSDDPPVGYHDGDVRLIVSAFEQKDRHTEYFLSAEISEGPILNVRTNDRMDSRMDEGIGYFVAPIGSTVNHVYEKFGNRSFNREVAMFRVTRENLEFLSHANVFQFRVNGPQRSIQRCTDAKHLHDLAEFLEAASAY